MKAIAGLSDTLIVIFKLPIFKSSNFQIFKLTPMKSHQHEQAFNLFFQTDFTKKQIADLLNIDRKTLFTWIKEGNWMRSKNAARHAPSLLTEQYYNQLCELNIKIAEREEMPYATKDEAEIIRKLTNTISHYNKKKASIGETIEVLSDFHEYLDRNYNGEGKYIMSFSDKYVQHLVAVGNKLDFGKQYYENLMRDKEYDQYLKEQDQLKQHDPGNNANTVMVSPGHTELSKDEPPLSAAEAISAKAAAPIKNYYNGKLIPIPVSRKNFFSAAETSGKEATANDITSGATVIANPNHPELLKDEQPALNAENVSARYEAASRNTDFTAHILPGSELLNETTALRSPSPLSPDRAFVGNFVSPEKPPEPATEATNEKITSTGNGEFLNSDKGKNNKTTRVSPPRLDPKAYREKVLREREESIRKRQALLTNGKR
jgi:predicted DNA-binding protein YlxM (UPF0122 family)